MILLRALGGIKNKPYAWQVKIVDLLKLFKKLIPLFEKRIGSSKFKGHTETLNFNFRKYTIQVKFEKGKVEKMTKIPENEDRTIGLNPYVFPELVLGYKSREELESAYPDFSIRSSHKELIDVLFPKNPSYIQYAY